MSLIDYQKYIRPGVIKEDIIELKEIFDLFDEDGSGSIEPKELIEAFEKGNYKIDKRVIY
jgi:Ca2+-binding EF-hand superfamily protein